jgi:hypothetical protein
MIYLATIKEDRYSATIHYFHDNGNLIVIRRFRDKIYDWYLNKHKEVCILVYDKLVDGKYIQIKSRVFKRFLPKKLNIINEESDVYDVLFTKILKKL